MAWRPTDPENDAEATARLLQESVDQSPLEEYAKKLVIEQGLKPASGGVTLPPGLPPLDMSKLAPRGT